MVRRTISLTVFFSFLLIVVSSLLLYIAPEGRVAYWGDWTIVGLTKSQWTNLHITGGFLFLIAALWHIALNWRLVVAYCINKTRKQARSPFPAVVALLICTVVYAGTLIDFPPMQQIIQWNAAIKTYQATLNGNPPYGHAELSSLEKFSGFMGLDADAVVTALQAKNLTGSITRETTILDIARANGQTPQQVYFLIRDSLATDPFEAMPPEAPEGTGKMTLQSLCDNYALPVDEAVRRLQAAGIAADPSQTIRAIGNASGTDPHAVYRALRGTP